jgi:predicted glycoside hydrolase/deacetylase ChbG (UPF0249 family)
MRELIVNADDFGLTRRVSQGILDAHRNGIVTSTTLLANGSAFWGRRLHEPSSAAAGDWSAS